jgi:hypothetical protein
VKQHLVSKSWESGTISSPQQFSGDLTVKNILKKGRLRVIRRLPPKTKSLIEHYHQNAPVDVLGIAAGLDLNVWEDNLEEGVSGKLLRDAENGGSSGYSIIVSSKEAPVRKRFTIAHEIAHFILHRNQINDEIEDDVFYRSHLSNAVETEANRLAADILMPYRLIDALEQSGVVDISGLSRALQVSKHALTIRLGIPVVD